MTYTDEKLKQFKIIRALISISAKFTVLTEITADLKSTKKHKFKKLKKFISESDSIDEKLSVVNMKNMIFVNDTLQTFNIMNQQTEIIISDYHSKMSRLNDDDWKKTLKKHKCALKNNDKKSSLIKRQCKKYAQNDKSAEDNKKVKTKLNKEDSAKFVINL